MQLGQIFVIGVGMICMFKFGFVKIFEKNLSKIQGKLIRDLPFLLYV